MKKTGTTNNNDLQPQINWVLTGLVLYGALLVLLFVWAMHFNVQSGNPWLNSIILSVCQTAIVVCVTFAVFKLYFQVVDWYTGRAPKTNSPEDPDQIVYDDDEDEDEDEKDDDEDWENADDDDAWGGGIEAAIRTGEWDKAFTPKEFKY